MPEPEILFSPLPEPKPVQDKLRDARHAESALFVLDQSLATPRTESRGGANDDPPARLASPTATSDEGSGLIDIRDLLDERSAVSPASPTVLPSDPPTGRHALVPLPSPTARRPRIPTPALLGIVSVLLVAFAALAWKVQALL